MLKRTVGGPLPTVRVPCLTTHFFRHVLQELYCAFVVFLFHSQHCGAILVVSANFGVARIRRGFQERLDGIERLCTCNVFHPLLSDWPGDLARVNCLTKNQPLFWQETLNLSKKLRDPTYKSAI